MRALEVVEPERRVEVYRVVFDQGELRPAHRAIDPARGRGGCEVGVGGPVSLRSERDHRAAMLPFFRNTLRERSSRMRRTAPANRGRSGATRRLGTPLININSGPSIAMPP